MSVARIASRYAKSLIELAVEQGKLERLREDVASFHEVIKHRDFYLMLKSPVVQGSKKKEIIKQLFDGKYDELTMAFLNILVDKGREGYLPEIASEFDHQYRVYKHISTVTLTTATEVSDDLVSAIKKKLQESTVTDETIEITHVVDPEIIGGYVLEFENRQYDASIAKSLEDAKKNFRDNLYISKIIAK
jgi:F-type H+-transporting ATPase subunit delta